MIKPAQAPVIVGVNGSHHSLEAVDAAAMEALHRERSLKIVYAEVPNLKSESESIIREAQLRAEKWGPQLSTNAEVIAGTPVDVLLKRSRGAAMVVVGDRGAGVAELLTGSTALRLAAHATCPVLVVHRQPPRHGPVVVGVDDHPDARSLVAAAAEEATLRLAELVVVHVWKFPSVVTPGVVISAGYDVNIIEAAAANVLSAAMAGLPREGPILPVRRELVHGMAGSVLVGWSREAQLVVVGDRGRGAFAGLLLGSVSQEVITQSGSPVLVRRLDKPS